MIITIEQQEAASLYWTQILSGEIKPRPLIESRKSMSPFFLKIADKKREMNLNKLNEQNPACLYKFMYALNQLIAEKTELVLTLDCGPQGLLADAAKQSKIPDGTFPQGKLTMQFDNKNNIIVSNQTIAAKNFLYEFNEEMKRDVIWFS